MAGNGPNARRRARVVPLAVIALALGLDVAAAQETDNAWPWSAVVRVLRDGKGPCSGVLVAPRTVLTVGHCVARRKPWRAVPAERLTVQFDTGAHRVTSVHVAERTPFEPDGAVGPVQHDWAVLELADAPAVTPVPYGGRRAARRAFILDSPVFKVGWSGRQRARDVACRVQHFDADGRAFSFTCPGGAGRGRSGSALIIRDGRDYAVIAVQSAEGRTGFTTIGLAVSPTRAVVDR